MSKNESVQSAQKIRDVLRYVKHFKNSTIVIHLDDSIIDSTFFLSHIKDIALLHKLGVRIVIVPGAKSQINKFLSQNNIFWEEKNGVRITEASAMSFIKTAAFDVANTVMTSFASENISAVIGNWVRSRSLGVKGGIDYGAAGEIEKLQVDSINAILRDNFVPIFPNIGWSATGKPHNISSCALATEIAIQLKAEKLLFVALDAKIYSKDFSIPREIPLHDNGNVISLSVQKAKTFLEQNQSASNKSDSSEQNKPDSKKQKKLTLLSYAINACENGVQRSHLLDGKTDGVIPIELFSDAGSGTMIFADEYGIMRALQNDDVPAVLSLMAPFVQEGKLLPRTEMQIRKSLADYIVYELDGGIHACCALHIYENGQAEIAALAVQELYAKCGVGAKLVRTLIQKAKECKCKNVFILSTQTFDWFEKFGFAESSLEKIPQKRQDLWNKKRGSKVYILPLQK